MNRISLSLVVLVSLPALACCSTAEARASTSAATTPSPGPSKLEAPVEIDSVLDGNVARLTLRFTSAANDVRVEVGGIDGLAVSGSPTLVAGASYDRGAVQTFDVPFTPGPGRSFLSVAVSGTFGGGGHLAKVRTVAVGTPSPEQQKANAETVKTPSPEGVKIVVPK
jgi:hypothetical protein